MPRRVRRRARSSTKVVLPAPPRVALPQHTTGTGALQPGRPTRRAVTAAPTKESGDKIRARILSRDQNAGARAIVRMIFGRPGRLTRSSRPAHQQQQRLRGPVGQVLMPADRRRRMLADHATLVGVIQHVYHKPCQTRGVSDISQRTGLSQQGHVVGEIAAIWADGNGAAQSRRAPEDFDRHPEAAGCGRQTRSAPADTKARVRPSCQRSTSPPPVRPAPPNGAVSRFRPRETGRGPGDAAQ